MKTAAIVNVRMGSTRLPGKALREICGKPLLQHLLDRVARARMVDQVVVATSSLQSNDPIESFCVERRVQCFRGSETDVLSRTVGALQLAGATVGVITYGDGPLIDPDIIDGIASYYLQAEPPLDFVGNDLTTTYPPGMEVEVFSAMALADANLRCADPAVREHGTLYLRMNPHLYRLANLEAPPGLRRPDLELEIDVEDDLQVVGHILSFFEGRVDFTLAEIIAYLDTHPEVAAANRSIERRWKVFRSGA